jgi:cell wall-associated NlpC family hydrolase
MSLSFDRRLHAVRPDLADLRLQGKVEAARFVAGEPATLIVPVADLRPRPDLHAGIDTQLLLGEKVLVFERRDGWAWVQAEQDRYVGYVGAESLRPIDIPTHVVTAPRSFVYPEADMKTPIRRALSMGSKVRIVGEAETRGTRFGMTDAGEAIILDHLRGLEDAAPGDHVTVAGRLLETPYLWGGRSGFGIDCSGLVQLSMQMTGRSVPRDTDMQAEAVGHPIERSDLQRGDLVFWKGHVAIVEDGSTILHANGHTMTVARERLDDAVRRIERLYGLPTGYRRP